jgi:hypothetical protein
MKIPIGVFLYKSFHVRKVHTQEAETEEPCQEYSFCTHLHGVTAPIHGAIKSFSPFTISPLTHPSPLEMLPQTIHYPALVRALFYFLFLLFWLYWGLTRGIVLTQQATLALELHSQLMCFILKQKKSCCVQ